MARQVWSIADSIVSPLGNTSEENYRQVRAGNSGIRLVNDARWSDKPFMTAAIESVQATDNATRFEQIALKALENALTGIALPADKTIFILSTTKGNIELLDAEQDNHPRIHLHAVAQHLGDIIGLKRNIVVSNACISGVLALIIAKRFLEAGQYDHAVVLGADVLSKFVVSGFQSLQAMSPALCKPFDANRTGINLGEAAGVMVLSAAPQAIGIDATVRLLGGAVSNDANHISGPSRTGEELALAVNQALYTSGLSINDIDFISAHGTATLYNDEMEAKAFDAAGLNTVPLNSLKGYYGHTLGAAGVIETIISMRSLLQNELIPTKGFDTFGVPKEINVYKELQPKPLNRILKTASGFGGCNAALVVEKVN
ncbi:MAG TPA: beta-ketoacyl synthase N-terminal-like domain-containing protein [Ohtaekwangia sp.]|uniref:beta-ketoacyl synthase N-terminal-like domain-containing protein n=1 Tax=Ohtaekwangia sp. TaxID=2066019 RepID=UPI002F94D1B5